MRFEIRALTAHLVSKFAVLAALCLSTPFVHAQATMSPCGKDVFTTVRVSEITPTGSVEKFKAAVAAHQAWYKSHGFKTNQIVIASFVEQDPATHAWKVNDHKFITYHINPPDPTKTKHDAEWDAYVKLYNETSKIDETYYTCMPETVISTDPVPWMKM